MVQGLLKLIGVIRFSLKELAIEQAENGERQAH
jgi:hypothetical protein